MPSIRKPAPARTACLLSPYSPAGVSEAVPILVARNPFSPGSKHAVASVANQHLTTAVLSAIVRASHREDHDTEKPYFASME